MITLLSQSEEPLSQKVLRDHMQLSAEQFGSLLRELLEQNRIVLSRTPTGGLVVALSSKGLSESFARVLDEVRRFGTAGVDQATLASMLRMPKAEISKALHSLVSQHYIQERRSFTNRAKKIYLLYNLEPSIQVTGGVFYCGEEVDINFVDTLRCLLVTFVFSSRKPVTLHSLHQFVESVKQSSNDAGREAELSNYCCSPISVVSSPQLSSPQKFPSNRSPFKPGSKTPDLHHLELFSTAAHSLASKPITPEDVTVLTRTLVLDGVLDEQPPHYSTVEKARGAEASRDDLSGYQYTIASGKSILRHFCTMRREDDQTLRPPTRLKLEDVEEMYEAPGTKAPAAPKNVFKDIEDLRGSMTPAPVSRWEAGENGDGKRMEWSYMPAIGFPCLGCPHLGQCQVNAVVNPLSCIYLKEWKQ